MDQNNDHLELLRFRNAVYMPGGICSEAPVVYDAEGRIIAQSQLSRGEELEEDGSKAARFLPQRLTARIEKRDEEVLFLGNFTELHFGHLITEGVRHCWVLGQSECPKIPIIAPRNIYAVKELLRSLLRRDEMTYRNVIIAFQLSHSDLRFVKNPTSFARVWIPEPSWIERHHVSFLHRRTLQRVARFVAPSAGQKTNSQPLYLSRSKLGNRQRNCHRETELESTLRSEGWRIVHPETLPLIEQINIINERDVIAGVVGSALHLLMFLYMIDPYRPATSGHRHLEKYTRTSS